MSEKEKVFLPSTEYGYVYVLKNECMPGLIKIGITDNLDERLRVLYNTSVPLPFKAEYACKVLKSDMRKIESALHKAFEPDRINPRREFFEINADRVIPILSLFQIENVTDEVQADIDSALDADDKKAVKKSEERRRTKRPPLNYHELGIADNEHLYWKDDETMFVTVCSERKVIYNGSICSLTAATQQILGTTKPIAPASYWKYNGRLLSDIYNEFYTPTDGDE